MPGQERHDYQSNVSFGLDIGASGPQCETPCGGRATLQRDLPCGQRARQLVRRHGPGPEVTLREVTTHRPK